MDAYVQRALELGVPLLIEFTVTGHETDGFVEDALRRLDALGALDGRNLFHSLDAETDRIDSPVLAGDGEQRSGR
jgi:glycerophosphoryl diester phosphodiesterase